MPDVLKTRLEAVKDVWQGLEPSDYASLIAGLKKHHIKSAESIEEIKKLIKEEHNYLLKHEV